MTTLTLEITRRWLLRVTGVAGDTFEYVVDSDRELAAQYDALASIPDFVHIEYVRFYGPAPAGLLAYRPPS